MNESVIRTVSSEMNRYLNNYQISKLTEVLYKRLYSNDKEMPNEEYLNKFRRTLATRAIDKGMPIELVQHLLGHTKIDTTLHYAMVNQNNVRISHRKYIC